MRTQEQPEGTRSGAARVGVEQAEAALVEHYQRLVRLAYITLPPSLGRHRRVLAAHAAVQRALPASRGGGPDGPRVPVQRGASEDPGYVLVRQRVLATALAYGERPGWWPRQLPAPRTLRPALPTVFGLRVFPVPAAPMNWPWNRRFRAPRRLPGQRSSCTASKAWASRTPVRC